MFVSPQGHHVTFFFSVPWCAEALCVEVIQLLVRGMLACARSRTWIQLLWIKSLGARLYAYQADLLDSRPICCNSIIRDSESRKEGCCRDLLRGSYKGPNLASGMRAGSGVLVNEGGDSHASWTQLAAEVWERCWKHELRREGVQADGPQVRGVPRTSFLER